MLGYAERHGQEATADLISIMAGWSMVTAEQQGQFRRMIAAGAQKGGLEDADVIGAMARGMPTIKAMGWTPEQAVETIAVLAARESGRKKMSLPATTLTGLMAPQPSGIEEFLVAEAKAKGKVTAKTEVQIKARAEELAQDPQQLLALLTQKQQEIDQKAFTKLLLGVYGTEAAAGVSKLLTEPRGGIREALVKAARPEGAEAEREEERTSRLTQRRRDARAKATAREEDLDRTTAEQYEEDIREIGAAKLIKMRLRMPIRTRLMQIITFKEREKEIAAMIKWQEELSTEERQQVREQFDVHLAVIGDMYEQYWEKMTPRERYEALNKPQRVPERFFPARTEPAGTEEREPVSKQFTFPIEQQVEAPVTAMAEEIQVKETPVEIHHHQTVVNHNYDSSMRFYPRIGDDERGPRFEQV